MRVRTKAEAWEQVDKLIPEGYELNTEATRRTGKPMYRSVDRNGALVVDLGNRLEVSRMVRIDKDVDLSASETTTIWIQEEQDKENTRKMARYLGKKLLPRRSA